MKKTFELILSAVLAALLLLGCTQAVPADSAADTPENTEEQTAAPETTEELTTQEETVIMTDPAIPEQTELKLVIATYNVKHCAEGIEGVADVIKASGADIIGIQEIDFLNSRSSGENQPKKLAQAAGYGYYKFARAIDYKGGQYGTLILSKYPIESFEVTQLEAGEKEGRSVGHAVIDLGGFAKLDFFNTHLSYEDKGLRTGQFAALAGMLAKCDNYALTGDFNTQDFSEFSVLNAPLLINRDGSRHPSYPKSSSAIDNIVLSDGFTEISAGTITSDASDHWLLKAELVLKKGE